MAAITGELLPQVRNAEPETAGEVQDSRNLLLAGTSLVAGDGKALVSASGAATQFGRIAHLAQSSHTAPSPLRRGLARLSRLIALLAVAIGILFFVAAAWIGVPPWRDLIFAIGIIVALVPEGLLPTLTLALVLAAQRMARRQVLIRNRTTVETLGSATVICTDKTGTLTENRMAMRELLAPGPGAWTEARTAASSPGGTSSLRLRLVLSRARTAAADGDARPAGDPVEVALQDMHRTLRRPAAEGPTARRGAVRRRAHAASRGGRDTGRGPALLQGRLPGDSRAVRRCRGHRLRAPAGRGGPRRDPRRAGGGGGTGVAGARPCCARTASGLVPRRRPTGPCVPGPGRPARPAPAPRCREPSPPAARRK